jgi:hypothetical protein
MFLHEYAPTKLLDQDVNYYGFLESKEHDNWMKSIEGQMLTSDIYESPYFGMMPSGAYRELDRVYEAYKISLGVDKKVFIDPRERENFGGGISPALILAAAAAFFFAG